MEWLTGFLFSDTLSKLAGIGGQWVEHNTQAQFSDLGPLRLQAMGIEPTGCGGFTRKDDYLPERFSTEPAPNGLGKGQTVDQDKLLDQIYNAKGWDSNGIPTPEKLQELGLEDIAV